MAVTTRIGRGGYAPTSSQKQLVDDEQVVQEEEVLSNEVQLNDEVHIDIDDSVEKTQEEVNLSRNHIIDIPELVLQKAKTLGIGQPRPISMRLQMTDHTMKRPLGVIEDVLVRVDKFNLLADFAILDCEVNYEVLIILGSPFLATEKALCDVE
uniref:Uncharacterized protein LOC104241791 n=1 Tax=Nicotiana sylvestris TaxID=4096 RepID=A0A1U7XSL4_NICSY|nr:PREDICTED: uncharacterized protein LOC104241791 [Nicotiana sylvestris]